MARIQGSDDGDSLSQRLAHTLRDGATVGALSGTTDAPHPAHRAT
jgi:hypothetical protein